MRRRLRSIQSSSQLRWIARGLAFWAGSLPCQLERVRLRRSSAQHDSSGPDARPALQETRRQLSLAGGHARLQCEVEGGGFFYGDAFLLGSFARAERDEKGFAPCVYAPGAYLSFWPLGSETRFPGHCIEPGIAPIFSCRSSTPLRKEA